MFIPTIETEPLATLFWPPQNGCRVREFAHTQFPGGVVPEEGNVRRAAVMVHVGFALEVAIYRNHIYLVPKLAPDFIEQRPTAG